jgi:hypothetical protein
MRMKKNLSVDRASYGPQEICKDVVLPTKELDREVCVT